uniref:uncharacterized protein LOC120342926 n=1 Tax=Styela clava TaxID=7725 RepID=UPI0019392722|nr:uncharacterized protein LOC120342926 [Styela clava]
MLFGKIIFIVILCFFRVIHSLKCLSTSPTILEIDCGQEDDVTCLRIEAVAGISTVSSILDLKVAFANCSTTAFCDTLNCTSYAPEVITEQIGSNPLGSYIIKSCEYECCSTDSCNNATIASMTNEQTTTPTDIATTSNGHSVFMQTRLLAQILTYYLLRLIVLNNIEK